MASRISAALKHLEFMLGTGPNILCSIAPNTRITILFVAVVESPSLSGHVRCGINPRAFQFL